MRKLILIWVVCCFLVANKSHAEQKGGAVEDWSKMYYRSSLCSDLLFKIRTTSTDMKHYESSAQMFRKSNIATKDVTKKIEFLKEIDNYENKVYLSMGRLANITTIYATFNCNIDDAAEQIACPDGWSEKCKLNPLASQSPR